MKKACVNLAVAAVVFIVYLTGCTRNEPPVIDRFVTDPAADTLVTAGDTVKIVCEANDPDADSLLYEFEAGAGTFAESQDTASVLWIAPNHSGTFEIICTVSDGDSLYEVTDTLAIDVQNYFPMAAGNWWYYEGQLLGTIATLRTEVYSREELAGGKVKWHIERFFTWGEIQLGDALVYYAVFDDSIWTYDPGLKKEYLFLDLPLWVGKGWDTGEGGTGTVAEIREYGTSAGGFENSARIDLNLGSDETDRTFWLAPDVGIIVTEYRVNQFIFDLDLVEYKVK